jgi:alkaline phosphatase
LPVPHALSLVGTYDDDRPGTQREKLGLYQRSVFPNYPPANSAGYPDRVDASKRLAVVFGTYPDHCALGRPYLDGENKPAIESAEKKSVFVANEAYCDRPGAVRRSGNLPFNLSSGVHSADGVILTAMGPGAELFRGRIENTRVFRIMATALGLGRD